LKGADRTLVHMLEHWATRTPDRVAVAVGEERATYAQLAQDVARLAAGLADEGIGPGDTVAMLMGNSLDMVRAWLALTRLGSVAAPINTAFRGRVLTHVLTLCDPRMILADAELVPTLSEIGQPRSSGRLVVRGDGGTGTDEDALRLSDLANRTAPPPTDPATVDAADPALVLFTSGTTGHSKACVLSHRYVVRQADIFVEQLGIRGDDVLFCPFPLFHADATIFTVAPAFRQGATAALEQRFSVTRFWQQVRAHGATVFDYMGATLAMLAKQPPHDDDRDHGLRLGWGVPLPAWAGEFEERFGVQLVEVYGLTDAGIPLYNRPGQPPRAGSCGRAVAPFIVRLLDEEGFEVPVGEVGEICIRTDEPGLLMTEYLGMPKETLAVFRDLWLHTGDLARQDEDGYFYFVGRIKDVIRRRGENISAFEVEEALDRHPSILEVAVVGVPSPLSEEEVKACVVLRPGRTLSAVEFKEYATAHLPRHMVPRYMEIYPTLPKTPTEKVEKHRLTEQSFTQNTIDLGESGRSRAAS